MRNRCPDRTMQTLNRIAPPAATEAATHGRGRLLMQAIITAVIVLATSHAGMVFTVPDGLFFSPVWPASGAALAALLLWGPRMLPAIYAGFAANHVSWGLNFTTMWIAPLGPVCEAWAAAWILTRMLGPKPRLTDLRSCFAFLVAAPWLPTLLIGLYETGLNVLDQSLDSAKTGSNLAVFVMANGGAIALLVPACVVWKTKPRPSWWRGMALLAPLCAASAAAVFALVPGITPAVLFPVLLAAAAVLGLQGAAPLVALVAVIAAMGTAMTLDPAAGAGNMLADYVSMYGILGLLAASVLPVAAIVDRYRGRARRMALAARASGLVCWSWGEGKEPALEADGGTRLPIAIPPGSFDPAQLFDASQDQGSREVTIEGRQALSSWAVVHRGSGGEPLEVAGTLMDLSDRQSAEKSKRRAWQSEIELRNLRASLAPHLLFNCLAAVRGIVRTDPERARAFIDHLSRFLRDSTNAQSRRTIPLLDEWQLCEDFLDLQSMRYERDLPRLVDIEGPAYHARVPPMMLLNLVENAVKHGEISQTYPLTATARLSGNKLVVTVSNRGKLGKIPSDRPGGLGVSRARLLAIYGDQASLQTLEDNGNVVVSLTLPASPPEEQPPNP